MFPAGDPAAAKLAIAVKDHEWLWRRRLQSNFQRHKSICPARAKSPVRNGERSMVSQIPTQGGFHYWPKFTVLAQVRRLERERGPLASGSVSPAMRRGGAGSPLWGGDTRMQRAEDRGQRTEDRGQRTEDRGRSVSFLPSKFFLRCDLVRFGAIWWDWRRGVQGSRFKVQGPARNWKRQELPVRAALRPDQTLLEACFHFYWV
jgi:hypothetical protein